MSEVQHDPALCTTQHSTSDHPTCSRHVNDARKIWTRVTQENIHGAMLNEVRLYRRSVMQHSACQHVQSLAGIRAASL